MMIFSCASSDWQGETVDAGELSRAVFVYASRPRHLPRKTVIIMSSEKNRSREILRTISWPELIAFLSTVNKIKQETDVVINIPDSEHGINVIRIEGNKAGVAKAKKVSLNSFKSFVQIK